MLTAITANYQPSFTQKVHIMADKAWKAFERFIASLFSASRNSLSGGNSKLTRSDSTHPRLFVSCKYTRHNNKTLRDLVAEERIKAKVENKIAVCVLGEFDDRANALVVLHLKDLHPFCEAVKNGTITTTVVPGKERSKSVRTGTVLD